MERVTSPRNGLALENCWRFVPGFFFFFFCGLLHSPRLATNVEISSSRKSNLLQPPPPPPPPGKKTTTKKQQPETGITEQRCLYKHIRATKANLKFRISRFVVVVLLGFWFGLLPLTFDNNLPSCHVYVTVWFSFMGSTQINILLLCFLYLLLLSLWVRCTHEVFFKPNFT